MQSNTFSAFFGGQNLITLLSVSSTNDYLKELLSKSKPVSEGTVIMADEQTKGRGNAGNTWIAEAGKNLTFSIVLRPSFLELSNQFDLSISICVSIFETLFPLLGDDLKIKWPNDIYVGNKKLGGVLIENSIQGSEWKDSVVGIGINVNQDCFTDLTNACSLKQLLHREYSINELLYELCRSIEKNYLELKANGSASLRDKYRSLLFGKNELRDFRISDVLVRGRIIDITRAGQLIIDFNGHSAEFGLKEIEFVF